MRGLISSLYFFLFIRALWTYPNGKQQKTGAEKSQRQINGYYTYEKVFGFTRNQRN